MELPPAHLILTRPSWTAHRTTRVLAEPPRCGGFLREVLAVGSGRLCFCPFSGQVRRDGGVFSVYQEQERCRSFPFSLSVPFPS